MSSDTLTADESLIEPLRERLTKLKNEPENLNGVEIDAMCGNDNDNELRRFLVARVNNLEDTYAMAADCLRWRCKKKPSEIRVSDFAVANGQGVWRFAGYAKNGWPVILATSSLWKPEEYSVDEYVTMLAFFMETSIKQMDPAMADPAKNGKHYIIFDMRGTHFLNQDFKMLRQFVKICADYYPERLGYGVVIHTNIAFQMMWKIIKRWMNKRTSEKAVLFGKDYHAFLDEHIGLENVTIDLGGTRKEEWPIVTEETQDNYCWTGRKDE